MSTPSTPPTPPGTESSAEAAAGPGPGPGPEPGAAGRWRVAGLVVHGVWALLLGLAIVLWVRIAVLPGPEDDVQGYVRLFGAPFVLLALGLLWWVWRSARSLRAGRPEGWTLPLALGAVALVQSAVTALPLAVSGDAPGWGAVAPFLAGAAFGAASVSVGVLGRRSRADAAPAGVSG